MVAFVSELQGPFGLWEYAARPQASRWVTFDLLRSLLRLKGGEPEEVDQPGAAYAVPGLSAAQKALLIRSWRNADRLTVAEPIRATSKVELKGLLWQGCLWAMQNGLPITRRLAHPRPRQTPAIRTPKAVGCMGVFGGIGHDYSDHLSKSLAFLLGSAVSEPP